MAVRKKARPKNIRKASVKRAWSLESHEDGTLTFRLSSWSHFFDFLEAEIFQLHPGFKQSYIWRGQRRKDWSLSSSLDRLFSQLGILGAGPLELERRLAEHLDAFKHAARGRRGPNPAILSKESDWWALGQHFGLATPLLDWSRSPFAAAYFAFEELGPDPTDFRVVYGLSKSAVEAKNDEIAAAWDLDRARASARERVTVELARKSNESSEIVAGETGKDSAVLPTVNERQSRIRFIDPMSDENQRLVSQGGLFTQAPIGVPIERWVAQGFIGSQSPVLLRIEIPNSDRKQCLRTLDRMNINHLSLFPDLSGASRWTNLKLELES